MVKYIHGWDGPRTPEQIKAAIRVITMADDTASLWANIFTAYYSVLGFTIYYLATIPTSIDHPRHFPVLVHYNRETPKHAFCSFATLLVQAMDIQDSNLSWDAATSDVYSVMKNMDVDHPQSKAMGAIAAGSRFVLFEVVGQGAPRYLIGNATHPADVLDEKEGKELEAKMQEINQPAWEGKFKLWQHNTAPDSVLKAFAASVSSGHSSCCAPTGMAERHQESSSV